MSFAIDEAGPVRDGEQLDVERLETYLTAHLPGTGGPLVVEQFPHGHSNLTYLIRLGDRELVLRRPPFGNRVKSAHDMGREYRILSRLCRVYGPAPCPVLFCDDESILGALFYVMERRRGVIFRRPPPPDQPLSGEIVRRLGEALVDNLARLHALDYEAAGLGDFGKPTATSSARSRAGRAATVMRRPTTCRAWSGPRPGWTRTGRVSRVRRWSTTIISSTTWCSIPTT